MDMGVSLPTVDNWCIRRYHIAPDQLQALADVLRETGVGELEVTRLVREELVAQGLKVKSLVVQDSRQTESGAGAAGRKRVLVIAWNMSHNDSYSALGPMCVESVERLGCEAMIVDCCGRHHLKRHYLAQASALGVDGVILPGVPGELPDPESDMAALTSPLLREGISVVFIRPWANSPELPEGAAGIGWDPLVAIQRSVDFLQMQGHTRIGGVFASESLTFATVASASPSDTRRGSFAFRPKDSVFLNPAGDLAKDEVVELVRANTALLASPNALEALATACYEAGIGWPEDISIMTSGRGRRVPQLGPRPFTSVDLPFEYVSHRTARLVVQLMAGETPDAQLQLVGADLMLLRNPTNGSVAPAN